MGTARPEGRKKYSKTAPLQTDELADLSAWWETRGDDPRAWRVNGPALIERDEAGQIKVVNLDLKNPKAKLAEDHRSPPRSWIRRQGRNARYWRSSMSYASW